MYYIIKRILPDGTEKGIAMLTSDNNCAEKHLKWLKEKNPQRKYVKVKVC